MMIRVRTFFLISIIAVSSMAIQGCIFVPFVDAFKQTGVTEGDRQQLLGPEMKRFTENLSAGSVSSALAYATAESRKDLAKQFEKIGDGQKVVDSKVIDVEFTEDSYRASAKVAVRYFEIPYYIVKTRREQQDWIFSLSSGWKLSGITITKDS